MSPAANQPTRIIGVAVNPLWAMIPKTRQKAIFNWGAHQAEGFEGGWPTWAIADFPQTAANDTQDSMIDLPDGFTLLAILGISYETGTATRGDFALNLYDVDREQWFFEKTIRRGTRTGDGTSPLYEKAPYSFAPENAQCLVRVQELAGIETDIQVILFGVVGGEQG